MTAQPVPTIGAPPSSTADSRSFGSLLSTSDNALNLVRLVLALSVIVAHTIPIAAAGSWPPSLAKLGGWAVAGFFVISGYLIVGSRLRSSWYSYTIRRLARIYPAYWVQLLIVPLVFAPLATLMSPSTWTLGSAASYIVDNATTFGLTFPMEGIQFVHFDAWNGSAWTLMYELLAYFACLLVFSIPFARRYVTQVAAVLLITLTAFNVAAPALDVTTNLYLHAGNLGAYFMAGVLTFGLRDRILARWWVFALSVALLILLFYMPWGYAAGALPLAYAVLAAGALVSSRIGAENDISYGVYIYAFPVQQMCSFMGLDRFGGVVHMLVATAITVGFAWLSWRYVEKPAMTGGRTLIALIRRS